MKHLLCFNGHTLLNENDKVLVRSIIEGHTYSKVFATGSTGYLYMQSFTPSKDVSLSVIETWNFHNANDYMLILNADYHTVLSNRCIDAAAEQVTVGDYTDVYHHSYTVNEEAVLTAGKQYWILIQPNENWLPDTEKMLGYFATIQDGTALVAETKKMASWLIYTPTVTQSEKSYDMTTVGGFSLDDAGDQPTAFIMINGVNIAEI